MVLNKVNELLIKITIINIEEKFVFGIIDDIKKYLNQYEPDSANFLRRTVSIEWEVTG